MIAFVAKVRSHSSDFSFAHVDSLHTRGALGGTAHGWDVSGGEVDRARHLGETNTVDLELDTTGDLTHVWVDRSDGIGGTNDLRYIEAVQVVEPAVVPATEDHKSAVAFIVAHCCVLTGRGALVILGHDVLPAEVREVHEAGGVDASTEGTWLCLTEVGALASKDEVLPGGDSLNHDSSVVPSGDTVEDVRVSPFARG